MKKIKIMLLSFALLAVVGGALAFKAKFNQPICYTTTTVSGDFCEENFIRSSITTDVLATTYYTTDPVQFEQEGLKCYTWIDPNNKPLGTTALHCPSEVRLTID